MAYKSRAKRRADQRLGTVYESGKLGLEYRSAKLKKYEDYYFNRQHDDKEDWFAAEGAPEYIPIHNRKPRIIFPLCEIITSRIAAKLYGENIFPKLIVEENPDASTALQNIVEGLDLRSFAIEYAKLGMALGSVFVRVKLHEGYIGLEPYSSNVCHPVFDASGDLEELKVQYVYEDASKLDPQTKEPMKFWYCFKLTKDSDILYDNPEYTTGAKPKFKVVDKVDHGLGAVQGEWLKLTTDTLKIDGISLIKDILGLADSLSYNLSMSDRASIYGIDPQLVIRGMDAEELDNLIKSKDKSWSLGREGEANFLELSNTGVVAATEFEMHLQRKAQEITTVSYTHLRAHRDS